MLEKLPCEILMLIADWVGPPVVFDLFDQFSDRPPAATGEPARP
jgi:hypothetical protein